MTSESNITAVTSLDGILTQKKITDGRCLHIHIVRIVCGREIHIIPDSSKFHSLDKLSSIIFYQNLP